MNETNIIPLDKSRITSKKKRKKIKYVFSYTRAGAYGDKNIDPVIGAHVAVLTEDDLRYSHNLIFYDYEKIKKFALSVKKKGIINLEYWVCEGLYEWDGYDAHLKEFEEEQFDKAYELPDGYEFIEVVDFGIADAVTTTIVRKKEEWKYPHIQKSAKTKQNKDIDAELRIEQLTLLRKELINNREEQVSIGDCDWQSKEYENKSLKDRVKILNNYSHKDELAIREYEIMKEIEEIEELDNPDNKYSEETCPNCRGQGFGSVSEGFTCKSCLYRFASGQKEVY